MLRIISQSFTKVNSFLLLSHALISLKINFKRTMLVFLAITALDIVSSVSHLQE